MCDLSHTTFRDYQCTPQLWTFRLLCIFGMPKNRIYIFSCCRNSTSHRKRTCWINNACDSCSENFCMWSNKKKTDLYHRLTSNIFLGFLFYFDFFLYIAHFNNNKFILSQTDYFCSFIISIAISYHNLGE